MRLDEQNRLILNILQKDCRTSLTNIAKEIKLSVDSTKKRIEKMRKEDVFFSKIQLRPRHFGYNNIVDVRIRLYHHNNKEYNELIEYLNNNPYIVELFGISGEWDLAMVIMTKDALDLGEKTREIRNKFGKMIAEWKESLTIKVYKFEKYEMERIE